MSAEQRISGSLRPPAVTAARKRGVIRLNLNVLQNPRVEELSDDEFRLRTAITRACRAAGVPTFSPHDLRHRRISLLHEQGVSWARIGERVGHGDIATTARHYTHVLSDGCEVDYSELIGS